MINFEEMRNKVDAVVKAMEKVETALGFDDDKTAAVEVPIDETFSLVAVRGGEAWFIMEGKEIRYDFIPDDDWTYGDIVGAYVDLYFERE